MAVENISGGLQTLLLLTCAVSALGAGSDVIPDNAPFSQDLRMNDVAAAVRNASGYHGIGTARHVRQLLLAHSEY